MSRRDRARSGSREAKAWHLDEALVGVALTPPRVVGSSIGSRPVHPILTPWEKRVLVLLVESGDVWHGPGTHGGLYTGRIAGQLAMTPRTPERDALGNTLNGLKKQGILHFEYARGIDREGRWWATLYGVEVAQA